MGAGVSEWRLANAVARCGQLGVVAGTALDIIMARRLQLGDPGGHMRRALAASGLALIALLMVLTVLSEVFYVAAGGEHLTTRHRAGEGAWGNPGE